EAEITRAKAVVESEAHRSAALEKDLNDSRKDVAKLMRSFETAKAEAEASRRQGQDRQKEVAGELATARAAVHEAKAEGARLKAELDELRKRAGKASELGGREAQLKAQLAKFDARSKELGQREATLAGSEARVRQREAESAKASRSAAERALEAENALKTIKERERVVEKAEKNLKEAGDRKSTRLNSSHQIISYAVFCLKKKNQTVLAASFEVPPQDLTLHVAVT